MQTPGMRHDSNAHRFIAVVDGQEAFLEYGRDDGVLALNHTVVPPEIGGRGIGGQLVQAALEFARSEGLKVSPRCSYAQAYLGKHPEYADLATA